MKADDIPAHRRRVLESSKNLEFRLSRCGVDQEIPVDVVSGDDIWKVFQNQELQLKICNKLVRQ